MARFMARNSKWPENIFYGQRGANMARLEKSGHQMARLATLGRADCLLKWTVDRQSTFPEGLLTERIEYAKWENWREYRCATESNLNFYFILGRGINVVKKKYSEKRLFISTSFMKTDQKYENCA